MSNKLGSIELGGTKIVCAYGSGHDDILEQCRIPTTDGESSLEQVIEFFKTCEDKHGAMSAIGVATFGPVDINPGSETYGSILKTPKPNWTNFNIKAALQAQFDVPVNVTTDVNGSLLGEMAFGAGKGFDNVVYITIGTGVGAGIIVNNELVSGFLHPEMGHMRIPTGGVKGICPFHENCLEGMVSGPAIAARAGMKTEDLPENDPLWDEVALNLADMCVNVVTMLATQRIILGGGVMAKPGLVDKIKAQFEIRMAEYLPINERAGGIDSLIVRPGMLNDCGIAGGFILADKVSV